MKLNGNESGMECERNLFENSWCLAMMMMMKTVGVDLKDCDDFFQKRILNERIQKITVKFKFFSPF
jgi:hypothetical protein